MEHPRPEQSKNRTPFPAVGGAMLGCQCFCHTLAEAVVYHLNPFPSNVPGFHLYAYMSYLLSPDPFLSNVPGFRLYLYKSLFPSKKRQQSTAVFFEPECQSLTIWICTF